MEPLSDPLEDRPVKTLTPPPHKPISHRLLFPENLKRGAREVPDWKLLKDHLSKEGKILKPEVLQLTVSVQEIMRKEPNVIQVREPVVVVGDIHGQFYDLVHLIEKAGDPTVLNYVFLGDYVDRGIYSVEVMILLFAMKAANPNSVYLLRGNHESRSMAEYFTFRQEVLNKYDGEVYEAMM